MQDEHRISGTLRLLMLKRGYLDVPSQGYSMYPIIRTGNICRFVPIRPNAMKKGDIILIAISPQRMIGHRYYGKRTEGGETVYLFRGDSNPGFDAPVYSEQIMGRMVSIRKPGGRTWSMDRLWLRIWGAAIVRIPIATRLIHHVLRFSKSRRGMSISPWIY